MTSSQHGPYELGYTRVTMGKTIGGNDESRSKSLNFLAFGLVSETRNHEGGIASNRGSARRGEHVPGSCTHRLSIWERAMFPKYECFLVEFSLKKILCIAF